MIQYQKASAKTVIKNNLKKAVRNIRSMKTRSTTSKKLISPIFENLGKLQTIETNTVDFLTYKVLIVTIGDHEAEQLQSMDGETFNWLRKNEGSLLAWISLIH